jgi:DNA repair exonuclease SbcCD ATPase subunit
MSLSETGLWLLPLLLAATLAALILFTRHWRKATHASLIQLRAQLRQLEARYKGLLQQADRFPVDSPEPYNKPARSIHSMLDSLEGELAEFKNGYITLQDKLHELNQNRFRALVAAPFLWNELYQDTNRLIQQTGAINNRQQEAQTNLDELQRIPLQVASHARTAHQLQATLQDRLNELHANHVHGAAMDAAFEESMSWDAAFKELPAFYLEGDESDLLQQATLPLTTQTYNLTLRAQPALLALDVRVEEWQNQRQEAVRQVSQLQILLGALQNLFSEMPAALNLSDLLAQFEQMQVIAQNLEATLGRLEIESAPNLIAETLHQQQIATGLERELRQARQQLGSLNKTLPDLDNTLKLLREQFDGLVASPVHPLRWGASWSLLDEQHQKAAALTQQTAPFTPAQVRGNLEAATQLLVEVKLLDQRTRTVAEQHAELLSLLDSPELSQDQRWMEGARSLVDKIAVYDPVNWPRRQSSTS